MEKLGELIVTDFIDRKVPYMESIITQFETEALSFNKKTNILCDVMKVGIAYGIEKGAFVGKCAEEKVKAAGEKSYYKWLNELFDGINENIAEHVNKNKYKKKK